MRGPGKGSDAKSRAAERGSLRRTVAKGAHGTQAITSSNALFSRDVNHVDIVNSKNVLENIEQLGASLQQLSVHAFVDPITSRPFPLGPETQGPPHPVRATLSTGQVDG